MPTVSGGILSNIKYYYSEALERSFNASEDAMVLISILGNFGQNRVDDLIRICNPLLLENGAKRRVMKRGISLMIESLQNINKHGATTQAPSSSSFLIVSKTGNQFKVTTGNSILSSDASGIEEKISHLNSLSPEELKKLYIETLCNDDFSFKGGAGLGLITIAKKSRHDLQTRILEIDDRLSFLVLDIILDNRE